MNDAHAQSDDSLVNIAASELTRRNLERSAYRAEVVREDKVYVVIFTDRKVPAGSRGIPASHPAIEVELDKSTLKVIKSYYVR